jgi:hypothetical protein
VLQAGISPIFPKSQATSVGRVPRSASIPVRCCVTSRV